MEFYIDTANIEEIAQVMPLGVLQGVTTNPTLIAKEKRDFQTLIRDIAKLVDGKIWCEVISTKAESMINEALEINSWAKNVVVKLPMGMEGIKAASILSRKGVETNMTLVYSVPQAILAAKAGVSYVSPYIGRVDDIGWSGMSLIKEIVDLFQCLQVKTKVIAASIRGPQQVIEALRTGVDAVTMPYNVFLSMVKNPMTDIGLEKFITDWHNAKL